MKRILSVLLTMLSLAACVPTSIEQSAIRPLLDAAKPTLLFFYTEN